jgi:hypothetical protein
MCTVQASRTTVGASQGYATLWIAPLSFPIIRAVQFIRAKIEMVCRMGIAGVLRRYYPRWLLCLVVTPWLSPIRSMRGLTSVRSPRRSISWFLCLFLWRR